MSIKEADYATSRCQKWHRGISLALVILLFAALALSFGLGQAIRSISIFVLPLVFIWQSDLLACWAIKDSGHWLNASNADRWVRIAGWMILLLMGVIRMMVFL